MIAKRTRLVDPPATPAVTRLRADANAISALYFGAPVYLVGGALTEPDPRDIDVVVIVPDELFVFAYGDDEGWQRPKHVTRAGWIEGTIARFTCDGATARPGPMWRRWAKDCAKWNARLTRAVHRRVDFKVQAACVVAWHHADRPRARLDAGEGG